MRTFLIVWGVVFIYLSYSSLKDVAELTIQTAIVPSIYSAGASLLVAGVAIAIQYVIKKIIKNFS